MPNELESALVIALRDTIKWESAGSGADPAFVVESGTLTPVNPDLPFDAKVYQSRDRELAYRDLIVAAAVVEVSVQVGDVYNYSVLKPTLQGPAPSALPFLGTEAGTFSSQVRHVTNVSIPYDAARYADADLYGRDALVYEVLARACGSIFVDPSIARLDSAGTLIPSTSLWSLGEGQPLQTDISTVLPLNRELFKNPDRNLADRDNQLAGYAAQLAQVLKNPFNHALRLYVQVDSYGTVQREPDVYALIYEDGTNRIFQTEPALPGANIIVYNQQDKTLQWVRELTDEVHVPQLYAMVIPGIEFGQSLETLAEVPERKDPQYWRSKAGQLNPQGVELRDTEIYLANTNNDSVEGGYMQSGSASLTVPDQITFTMTGEVSPGHHRVSVLTKPNSRVEIAGAQNISNTSGTLGGATFDIDVASGDIDDKVYLVEGGGGIVYDGATYLAGDTFAGTSITPTYTQYGLSTSRVRQYAIGFVLALPVGPYNVRMEYTNLSGVSDAFSIKAEYIATGANAVVVFQDLAPLPFDTTNGNIVLTPIGGMDVMDTGQFSFPVYWTAGTGQLHIRKLTFESAVTSGRYAIAGTFVGSTAQVDVTGEDKFPGVMRWQFAVNDSTSGSTPFILNYTEEADLPLQLQQVQVQTMSEFVTTSLSRGFQGWRQECLDRAERIIVQNYARAVAAYGTDVPTFRIAGTNWEPNSSEDWMSFVEVFTPRLREIPDIATDGIADGYQYEVTTPFVTYGGTVYTEGQKFYGVESTGSEYTDGLVRQVGAFIKSKAGHIGKPCLVPRGLYFDTTVMWPKAYYDTSWSTPILMACQPWMIESGLYVAQHEFWMPEVLGLGLPLIEETVEVPVPITPTTYPALLAWWDASQLDYADGTIIDGTTHKFVDQTGNGYDATPGGGGAILKTGIINGQNVVRFNGVADYLIYTQLLGLNADYTIIFIGTANNDGMVLGLSSSNVQGARLNWGSTNTISNFLGSSDIVSLPFTNLSSVVRMSSWRRTGILIKHRENKTDRTGVIPTDPPSDGSAWTVNQMGHYWAGLFLAADVGEILVYNAYLTDEQMDSLYDEYFVPKWGLPA